MRATTVLRNAAQATKPKPMSADHTLYHHEATGFWKKFRDVVVVNPEISSGLPIPMKNRYPQPASRTELQATPATKASDPAFNPYYKRDSRRMYPQTSTITQDHLSSLLLASPSIGALPEPKAAPTPMNSSGLPATAEIPETGVVASVPSLASVINKLPAGQSFLGAGIQTGQGSGSKVPPTPPGKRWVPQPGDEIPSAKDAYFPMIGYK